MTMPSSRKRFSGIVFGLMVLIPLALGAWQLQRLEWKTALLERINEQMAAPAIPLPHDLPNASEWEYRNVSVEGIYLHQKSLVVKPRTRDGRVGYEVITPLQESGGRIILVDRGWVPDDFKGALSEPAGRVHVQGILRMPRKGPFVPANNPAKKDWYWVDIPAMAASLELENVSPVLVVETDTVAKDVYPSSGGFHLDIPNDHRQYAVFWFLMAAIFVALGIFYHRKKLS